MIEKKVQNIFKIAMISLIVIHVYMQLFDNRSFICYKNSRYNTGTLQNTPSVNHNLSKLLEDRGQMELLDIINSLAV